MNLVIIEGVGKQPTIQKYLGNDYEVVATKGHVRDLPAKKFGVNFQKNFEPEYAIMPDKKSVVTMLKSKAKQADKIYLATDPDREGEAISWHIAHILGMDNTAKNRIEFNEITKNAILKAMQAPRSIDLNLVNAQQARRVLDRIVGYKLSPIISKKIQPKLSAGRVQSVALKLVVEREHEIRDFVPQEYWTMHANLFADVAENAFKTTLAKYKNKKANLENREQVDIAIEALKQGKFVVKNVKKAIKKTRPYAPFTTSTLQQDAASKLGFTLKRTSMNAQQLYEGVTIKGEGKVALVTYIRTDSVRVAPEAQAMAKEHIINTFGDKYYPTKPNFYASKKQAQDAHEAIRPISLERTPEKLKQFLTPDNYKLYKLIYERFVASQMAESTYHSVIVEIENGDYMFKASGKTPIFDGFLAVYNTTAKAKKSKKTEEEQEDDDKEGLNDKLPELQENDLLQLLSLQEAQKFTKPPTRYTEGTLVNEMEAKGIGRPATYAATVTTLATRHYTQKEGKYLQPTELGEKVVELLDKYFAEVINVKFTAEMEDRLDEITDHETEWQQIIKEFYSSFEKSLKEADEDSVKFKIPPKETDQVCEKCGHKMVIRTGRYGEFLACSNFPECRNIKSLHENKPVAKCPTCGTGDVYMKKSKRGTTFYGCSNYPDCNFMSWDIPLNEPCPKCGANHLTYKQKGKVKYIKCSNKECDYTRQEQLEEKEEKNS